MRSFEIQARNMRKDRQKTALRTSQKCTFVKGFLTFQVAIRMKSLPGLLEAGEV